MVTGNDAVYYVPYASDILLAFSMFIDIIEPFPDPPCLRFSVHVVRGKGEGWG